MLLKGIETGQAQLSELSLDQRQSLQSHPDKMLAARAKKLIEAGGGLPDPDRVKVLAELMPLIQKRERGAGKGSVQEELRKMPST